MANICTFRMKISGDNPDSIATLFKYLASAPLLNKKKNKMEYVYDGETVGCHFYGAGYGKEIIYESTDTDDSLYESIQKSYNNGKFSLMVSGGCIWSVNHAFLWESSPEGIIDRSLTNLQKATEELELLTEIIAFEPGCSQLEHCIAENGHIIMNENSSIGFFDAVSSLSDDKFMT